MFGQTTNRGTSLCFRCFLSVKTADNIAFERRRQSINYVLFTYRSFSNKHFYRAVVICATVQEVIYGKKKLSVIFQTVALSSERSLVFS